jgi:lipopolysaccharide export system permease protein
VRILSRRFLASYLAWLAANLTGLLLALAIVEILVDFGAVVEGARGACDAALRAPARYLREALPLASFAAAFLAVALPARRGEILALRAAGIPPARAAGPVLGAALAVAAAAPWLDAALLAAGAPADAPAGERAAERGAAAWHRAGERFYRIGRADPGAGRLRDLSLFELDPEFRLRSRLRAAEARVVGGRFELRGAQLLRFDPAAPAAAPRAQRAPEWLPAPAPAGPPPAPSALALPAAVAVLALLALPLGLGVRPASGLAAPALAALALAACFRGTWQAAAFAAERAPAAGALAPALALAGFGALAAALWRRAPR